MISDGTVFDDDHLPDPIVGRNSHMNEVTYALAPIEDGFRAENCFLFGPSGVGKTTSPALPSANYGARYSTSSRGTSPG